MRVVALYRVSTERQENEGASLDAQQRRYRELAAINGWETVAEFRGQESATKAASERLVLQQVLDCIRERDVDAVWVYEQSRLTRGDLPAVFQLTTELGQRKTAVIVGSSRRDLADISDALAFNIQSLVDHAEAQRFKERVARGKREKARQGKKASGITPFGYFNPPPGDPERGKLRPVPEQARIVRRIFEASAAGLTPGRLSRQLNAEGAPSPRGRKWAKNTIRNILNNPVYLGTVYFGAWQKKGRTHSRDLSSESAVVTENAHEAIVSRDLWESSRLQRQGSSTGAPGMLTGFLYIEGRRVAVDSSHGTSYYRPTNGSGPWVQVSEVNRLAWQGFVGLLRHDEALTALLDRAAGLGGGGSLEAELREIAARRERMATRLDRYVEMRADGILTRDELAAKMDETRKALRGLDEAAASARRRAEAVKTGHNARVVATLKTLTRKRLSADQQRRALRALVERADVKLLAMEQPRGEGGMFMDGAKWRCEDVYLGLHRAGGADLPSWSSSRSPVTVQIVAGGELLRPAEAIRQALRGAA